MYPWTGFDSVFTRRMQRAAIVFSLAAVFVLGQVVASAAEDTVWRPLVERLVEDGYDRTYVESLFGRKSLKFDPRIMARKMNVLLDTKLSKHQTDAPVRKPKVMSRYLNPILIAGAYAFFREHQADFAVIEEKYGVPGEVLTGLMLVETKLGTQVGRHNALTILAGMALGGDVELIRPYLDPKDVPPEIMQWLTRRTLQKGNWGYGELKSLISYARKNGQDPLNIPSSVYGAIGLCQFIPSSAIHYGVDGNGDGRVDLFDMKDALHSMANFVKRHGWKPGLDRAAQLKVIYRYNHSESYALTILAVADRVGKTNSFFGN